MTEETITEPTEEEVAIAQLGLPIEHLMMVDPLDITSDDLLLLVSHYRNQRLVHMKAMERPKAVQKNRNEKLDAEKSRAEIDSIFNNLFGEGSE